MKVRTVNRRAIELLNNGMITACLEKLKKPIVDKARITFGTHLADLKLLRDQAVADRNWSVAVAAEVARGRASGLYVHRVEDIKPERTQVNVILQQVDPNWLRSGGIE